MSEAIKLEPPKSVDCNRIVSVRFREAVPWRGEQMGATQGPADADSIVPARLEPDGRAVPIEKGQASAGLLLMRKYHDRIANKSRQERVFVPMALIRGIIYGE
jgi:hypothetical protein